MTDRRFTEAEVAAIFERAASAPPAEVRERRSPEGLTQAQLEDIGREVGIPEEAIAAAVVALDQRGTATSRRLLGMPIGVGRTIELPRRLSDDEWDRLVVDLRETFDARGQLRSDGSLRQWTNGNLQAMLEPTAHGQRLRLRTFKGAVRTAAAVGGGLGVVALALLAEAIQRGSFSFGDAAPIAAMAAAAVGAIGVWASRLPGWARTRRDQMEAIIARLMESLRANP